MKLTGILSTVVISIVVLSSCAFESTNADYTSLDSLIEKTAVKYINEHNVKGIAVGFIDVGNYRAEKGFGNVDASSFFPMASVTKVITAAAIMQLVERGEIDLNGSLRDYIPGFELKKPYPDSPEITIKHILTHTSGLSRDIMSLAQGYCPPDQGEVIDYIKNHRQIIPAGYRHSYSNPGFDLLAMVIENVTDTPYTTYVRKNIFEPLNMDKSYFFAEAEGGDLTESFTMFSSEVYNEMPINYLGAGGLKSNVPEMLFFAEMLLQQKANHGKTLLENTSLKEMFSQQNTDALLDTDITMGVSVYLEELPHPFTGKLVYHGGGAIFTNNMLLLAPDYGLGVVVLCNTAGSYQMVEQLARNVIYKALEIKTGHKIIAPEHKVPEEYSWSAAEKQKITGHYLTQNNVIKIQKEEDSVIAEIGANRFPLTYFEDGFFSYYEGFYLKVDQIGEEQILFSISNGNLMPIGKQMDLTKLSIPSSWKNATGTYVAVNPCPEGATMFYESLRVHIRNNRLYVGMLPEKIVRDIFGITSEMPVILTPHNDTIAFMPDFGRYSAEPVLLNSDDGSIMFSGLTFVRRH